MPYVPFFNKQFPTKSGKIEFYVEMLVPFDQELAVHKEPIEASPTNPLYEQVPARVPVHPHQVPHPLAVREPAVAEGSQQRRAGFPGDQPQGQRRPGASPTATWCGSSTTAAR